MKKVIFMAALTVFFMTTSVISFARESEEMKGSMMGKGMKGSMKGKCSEGMMKQGKMMGMCPMRGMMKMMMSKEIVATDDGGVIVMTGNRLMKFDKDLNLVKEVEIKMDMEGMHKMMKEMKERCSMGGSKGSKTSEKMSGHESHHQ